MSEQMTAGEAVDALQVYRGLMLEATSAEDIVYIEAEMAQSPEYQHALKIESALGRIVGLVSRVEGRSESPAKAEIIREDLELVESGDEAEKYEQKQNDIMFARRTLEGYSNRLQRLKGRPTRKQLQVIERESTRQINGRLTEFVEEPARLLTTYESILANGEVPERHKQGLIRLLEEKFGAHIERNAENYSPDAIGEWLKVAARDSVAQEAVQTTLLGSYFRSVDGEVSERTLANYELYLRGVLRVVDYPGAMQLGLQLLNINEDLGGRYAHIFRSNSVYHRALKIIGGYSYHQPELIGRSLTALRVHSELTQRYSDGLASFMPEALDLIPDNPHEITERAYKNQLTADERLLMAYMSRGIRELGQAEYMKRLEIFYQCADLWQDDNLQEELINELFESSGTRRVVDILQDKAIAKYPQHTEFIKAIMGAESPVRRDAELFAVDQLTSVDGPMMRGVLKELSLHDPDIFDGAEVEDMDSVSVDVGDGYIVSGLSGDGFSPEDYTEIVQSLDPALVEEAKQRFNQRSGVTSRYEILLDEDNDPIGFLRKETKEDRNQYHPIDQVLAQLVAEVNGPEPEKTIESYRNDVLQHQRRFMNNRGIHTSIDLGSTGMLELTLKKHTRNPQAFVVSAEMNGVKQRYVVDPNLMPYIGNKQLRHQANLVKLHTLSLQVLKTFMCQEIVETDEGMLGDGKSVVTSRIAHLRLLPEGQRHSYEAWKRCLEVEGLDLEVLSLNQQLKLETDRFSTYVSAVETDEESDQPLVVHLPQN